MLALGRRRGSGEGRAILLHQPQARRQHALRGTLGPLRNLGKTGGVARLERLHAALGRPHRHTVSRMTAQPQTDANAKRIITPLTTLSACMNSPMNDRL
ncbi:hypothetical protein [Elstera litoralis]|uniref:hypothetical protein n=1 Tax=Elstera litoralis TaxID=552518 RepID=UPI000698F6C5|nr:hypothetical protein [Elstera litoralis]